MTIHKPKRHRRAKSSYHTLLLAFVMSFFIMGWALANQQVRIASTTCSLSLFLHIAYFLLLTYSAHRYGGHHAQTLWATTTLTTLFFIALAKGILYTLPTQTSTLAPIALWEARIPSETLLCFLLSSMVHLITTRHKPKSTWRQHIIHHTSTHLCVYTILLLLAHSQTHRYPHIINHATLYAITYTIALLILYALLPSHTHTSHTPHSSIDATHQLLTLLFYGACLFTNLLVVKHVAIAGKQVTAALFIYTLTFPLTDILCERYGTRTTISTIVGGFVTNLIMLSTIWLGTLCPKPLQPLLPNHLFEKTFSFAQITIIASIITYIIAQTLDVYLFHYLRQRTQGRHLWLRNNLATSCSQLIDTLIFATLAWHLWRHFHHTTPFTWPIWARISLHEYLFKLIFALLDTPIVYLVLGLSTKAKKPPKPTHPNH